MDVAQLSSNLKVQREEAFYTLSKYVDKDIAELLAPVLVEHTLLAKKRSVFNWVKKL